jgi:hypothetical protein
VAYEKIMDDAPDRDQLKVESEHAKVVNGWRVAPLTGRSDDGEERVFGFQILGEEKATDSLLDTLHFLLKTWGGCHPGTWRSNS